MPKFRMDNGLTGKDQCQHIATGYSCPADYQVNDLLKEPRVMFFVRHVVGSDGYPYTEAGLNGLEEFERPGALSDLKNRLRIAKFLPVENLQFNKDNEKVYKIQKECSPDTIAIRFNAGSKGIRVAMDVLGDIITEASRKFIEEQEQIENVIFYSLMNILGPQMMDGPGDKKYVEEKIRTLSNLYIFGTTQNIAS